jgi:hypothetical protein
MYTRYLAPCLEVGLVGFEVFTLQVMVASDSSKLHPKPVQVLTAKLKTLSALMYNYTVVNIKR